MSADIHHLQKIADRRRGRGEWNEFQPTPPPPLGRPSTFSMFTGFRTEFFFLGFTRFVDEEERLVRRSRGPIAFSFFIYFAGDAF